MVDFRVVYDGRWSGDHGIGRFAREIATRLPWELDVVRGAHPVSARGLVELPILARRHAARSAATHFMSPGFCPPLGWRGSFSFTIHDLIHLDVPEESSPVKTEYYKRVVLPHIHRAQSVYTVSEFSRGRIIEWSGVPDEKVVVAANGVDRTAFAPGPANRTGRPYVLHVGNHKPHKNLPRLIRAFGSLRHDDLDLVLSGEPARDLVDVADAHGVGDRLRFAGHIPEGSLADWYRNALVVAIPSLYEGFGLPALEAMSTGVPVVASDRTGLPEVVGEAGILVDPADIESIADGLERGITGSREREVARRLGPRRAAGFSWEAAAQRIVDTTLTT